MKIITLMLLSVIWLSGFSQNLQSNPWRINQVIGRNTDEMQEFTLEKIDTTNQGWMWGNTIRFFPDGNFSCKYSAWCGNDCFPSSNGSYDLSDSTHVKMFLKEYNQVGECENIHRTIEKIIGTYLIVAIDAINIKLIKLNE